MATESVGTEVHERTVTRAHRNFFAAAPISIGWGAILAGAACGLAVWALLYALGLALGLSAIDPMSPSSLRASGIFTGIWSLIIPIVALFVGGAVASRGANVVTRWGGAIHGLIVWALVALVGAWLLIRAVSAVAMGVGGMAAWSGAALGSAMEPGGYAEQAYRSTMSEALAPLNERLMAEGKPRISLGQVETAANLVLQQALRTGTLDKEAMTSAITQSTALSRAEAGEVTNRIASRIQSGQAAIEQSALRAADATGKAFWGVFWALLLGLGGAVLGATLGVTKRPSGAPLAAGAPLPASGMEQSHILITEEERSAHP